MTEGTERRRLVRAFPEIMGKPFLSYELNGAVGPSKLHRVTHVTAYRRDSAVKEREFPELRWYRGTIRFVLRVSFIYS